MSAVDSEIVGEIVQDLDLPARGTEVLQLSNDRYRDVAIVLTKSRVEYTLWCVYRDGVERVEDKGDWKLWINYAASEDGTGVEEPAKRSYSEMPDTEAIAAFKSEILKHWSNR